jgi:hypothetical protein
MKALLITGFFLVLIGLGILDSVFTGEELWYPEVREPTETPGVTPPVKEPSKPLPNILGVLKTQGITAQETSEVSLIRRVIPQETPVTTLVLLREGDRIGLLSWVESSDVERHFLSLKESLHVSFSPDVRDLRDEQQKQEGKPSRNILSFFDPSLGHERFIFIHIQKRLYELRIAEGKDEPMNSLIDALTQ